GVQPSNTHGIGRWVTVTQAAGNEAVRADQQGQHGYHQQDDVESAKTTRRHEAPHQLLNLVRAWRDSGSSILSFLPAGGCEKSVAVFPAIAAVFAPCDISQRLEWQWPSELRCNFQRDRPGLRLADRQLDVKR